jgi:L-alanine-DL-glutamate epimerase-like enolase superfamily enzyme
MKITKHSGLTKCRRIRDICLAAGYSFSFRDTVSSDFAFAAIFHLGQTVTEKYLRCILGTRDMVMLRTADGPLHIEGGLERDLERDLERGLERGLERHQPRSPTTTKQPSMLSCCPDEYDQSKPD